MEMLRLSLRLGSYLLLTLVSLPIIMLLQLIGLNRLKMRVTSFYYKLAARSWGIQTKLQGGFAKDRPLLVVSNHCSYTDIPVLGSLAPLHFTPKSDIGDWPVIGYLCRLSDCIFINRNPRKTAENMVELRKAMESGWMISLFPEGTTNDGTKVKPFRSSYFSLAELGVTIQPVTVRYTKRDGSLLDPIALRKTVWIDDDEFAPHLLSFLKQPSILATVTCHDPLSIEEYGDRKALATACYERVKASFGDLGPPKG